MYFHFKKFSIKQSASAMKVGTDAVLLGASTPLGRFNSSKSNEKLAILDIGAGTGVLSLMIAQRFPKALITAIEIDEAAAEECEYNFKNSPFADRLTCIYSSLEDYLKALAFILPSSQEQGSTLSRSFNEGGRTRTQTSTRTEYHLIISNPPFFPGSQAVGSRKKARDSQSLPAEDLITAVDRLLHSDGQFSLIIPFSDEDRILKLADDHLFSPFEIQRVRGRKESKFVRSIIHFNRNQNKLVEKEMFIEVEKRHEYSEEYLELMRDFLI